MLYCIDQRVFIVKGYVPPQSIKVIHDSFSVMLLQNQRSSFLFIKWCLIGSILDAKKKELNNMDTGNCGRHSGSNF